MHADVLENNTTRSMNSEANRTVDLNEKKIDPHGKESQGGRRVF